MGSAGAPTHPHSAANSAGCTRVGRALPLRRVTGRQCCLNDITSRDLTFLHKMRVHTHAHISHHNDIQAAASSCDAYSQSHKVNSDDDIQ